jgi:hypothetical protein
MKPFFILAYEEDDAWCVIDDYAPSQFDPTPFWLGTSVDPIAIQDLTLLVKDGHCVLPDFVSNPLSLPIASARLLDVLNEAGVHFEHFQAPVKYAGSDVSISGYSIINVLGSLDCLDLSRSAAIRNSDGSIRTLIKAHVDEHRVPSDRHMFRINELPGQLIVDDVFRRMLSGARITGVALVRM